MANAPFINIFEQSQDVVAPIVKTNQAAVANLEKLVSFQFNALQSYVDLGMSRLKAAAEVSNPQDLQTFFQGQVEAANVLRQKSMEDAKALAEILTGIQAEFTAKAQDNVTEFSSKATKAVKETADKAAKSA
jgi:phasin family protein